MFIAVGLSAAIVAYLINRISVKRFGTGVIIYITPIIEEGLKTGLAVLANSSIILVHVVFGVIECIYDIKTTTGGMIAGVLSLIWHLIFGVITVFFDKIMGNIVYGLLMAIFLHYLANSIVIKPKEERK